MEDNILWYDVRDWGVEGRGWNATESYFDRLPAKAKGVVRDQVWGLSQNSAGMAVRFEADTPAIWARYTLRSGVIGMPHMPATGVSGLDLYGRGADARWHWLGVTQPQGVAVKALLAGGIEPGRREYRAYLPLYNGVKSLEIGVPAKAAFAPLAPRKEKSIVFYGTSIMQGGCASRPGMAFAAILGRRLDQPTINLGFSGSAIMEPEVGSLLAELDASVFVVDCLPNMSDALVAQRTEPLVRQLRNAHPETPIVLVEDRTFAAAALQPGERQAHAARRAALKTAYRNLQAAGVKGLAYVKGEHLLGDDGEGTVDSSHPNDLGMMRMADAMEPVLKKLLQ
jgi:hypothetical protein